MITNISSELHYISNLRNTAIFHKENCQGPDCNVSVYILKQTARFIADRMRALNFPKTELEEANKFISEMPMV